jgi:Putative MetA-pathway of phenol degradation
LHRPHPARRSAQRKLQLPPVASARSARGASQLGHESRRLVAAASAARADQAARAAVDTEGIPAERSLQPGTGTLDALIGGYFRQNLPLKDFSWFVQAAADLPLNSYQNYKPGNQLTATVGLRYEATERLGLMLQANSLFKGRDSGAEAEPENSGGTFVFLSPGLSYAITKNVQLYAFYQHALYQYVNGVQLTADWSAVAGISARF